MEIKDIYVYEYVNGEKNLIYQHSEIWDLKVSLYFKKLMRDGELKQLTVGNSKHVMIFKTKEDAEKYISGGE